MSDICLVKDEHELKRIIDTLKEQIAKAQMKYESKLVTEKHLVRSSLPIFEICFMLLSMISLFAFVLFRKKQRILMKTVSAFHR